MPRDNGHCHIQIRQGEKGTCIIYMDYIKNNDNTTPPMMLLNAVKCGTIAIEEALSHPNEVLEQMKKNDIIKNHPFEIYTTERHGKPYYTTYVYDATKKIIVDKYQLRQKRTLKTKYMMIIKRKNY